MNALTTLLRFKTAFGLTLTASQDASVTALIGAASTEVEKFLARDLLLQSYRTWLENPQESWLDGPYPRTLALPNWPITSIMALCLSSKAVGRIANSTATHATVFIDATGVTLFSITAGVEASDTLPFASNPTINAIKAAAEALGRGWSVTIETGEGLEPSSYLKPLAGANAASGGDAALEVATDPRPAFVSQEALGCIEVAAGSRYQLVGAGANTIFVHYRAGYTLPADSGAFTFPLDLERVVQEIVKQAYDTLGKAVGIYQSESISGYSYSLSPDARNVITGAMIAQERALSPYKRL